MLEAPTQQLFCRLSSILSQSVDGLKKKRFCALILDFDENNFWLQMTEQFILYIVLLAKKQELFSQKC